MFVFIYILNSGAKVYQLIVMIW